MLERAILATVVILWGASAAPAQMGAGRAMGSVEDSGGKPLAGVHVTARDAETNRRLEATTVDDGTWALLGFRSATYEFTFMAAGFEPKTMKRQMKQSSRNASIDVVLEPAESRYSGSAAGRLLAEANDLFEESKYAEALAKYQELLAAEPNLHRVYFNIGTTYREMGEAEKAIEAYGKLLAEQPLHSGALVGTGEVLISEGRLDEAVPYLERAVEHTLDAIVPFNVAEIHAGQGNSARAIQYYQIASDRSPEWADPHLKMAYAHLGAGDLKAATAAFERVLELAPADSPQAEQAELALSSLAALNK